MRDHTYEEFARLYKSGGITDEQLDGTGAAAGSVYAARNYVTLERLTQAQADAVRAGAADPETAGLQTYYNETQGVLPGGNGQ